MTESNFASVKLWRYFLENSVIFGNASLIISPSNPPGNAALILGLG